MTESRLGDVVTTGYFVNRGRCWALIRGNVDSYGDGCLQRMCGEIRNNSLSSQKFVNLHLEMNNFLSVVL